MCVVSFTCFATRGPTRANKQVTYIPDKTRVDPLLKIKSYVRCILCGRKKQLLNMQAFMGFVLPYATLESIIRM